jgi:hypothetical protein
MGEKNTIKKLGDEGNLVNIPLDAGEPLLQAILDTIAIDIHAISLWIDAEEMSNTATNVKNLACEHPRNGPEKDKTP